MQESRLTEMVETLGYIRGKMEMVDDMHKRMKRVETLVTRHSNAVMAQQRNMNKIRTQQRVQEKRSLRILMAIIGVGSIAIVCGAIILAEHFGFTYLGIYTGILTTLGILIKKI